MQEFCEILACVLLRSHSSLYYQLLKEGYCQNFLQIYLLQQVEKLTASTLLVIKNCLKCKIIKEFSFVNLKMFFFCVEVKIIVVAVVRLAKFGSG